MALEFGTPVCDPLDLETESQTSLQCFELFSHREEEARKVLQTSTNFNEIRLVLILFPFENPDIRFALLSKRWFPRLDALLSNLPGKDHGLPPPDNETALHTLHKAKEILRRLSASLPDPPIWNSLWSPPIQSPVMSAAWIASDIDKAMSDAFSSVAFPDFVRGACGYRTRAVAELLVGVDHARRELRRRFYELLQPKNMYELAEKELKTPLGKWAVHNGMSDNAFPDPRDALGPIYIAIRDLFTRQDLTLIPMLKHLAVLSAIHHLRILSGEDATWDSLTTENFWFLEQISTRRPWEFAKLLTDTDHAYFRQLSADDVDLPSSSKLKMSSRWDSLVWKVKTCLVADPNLVEPISEVAEILLNARNFFSGMALLQGLRDTHCCPTNLEKFWKLLDTENMYANYRASLWKGGGLVFFFPHIHELRRAKNKSEKGQVLSELFRVLLKYPGFTEMIERSETTSACLLGEAETDNEGSPASSGLWGVLIFFLLGNLLPSVRRCLSRLWNRPVISRGHDIDIEKGVKPAECLDFLDVSFDTDKISVGLRQKRRKWKAVLGRPLVKRTPKMRKTCWCEKCEEDTGRIQGRCMRCDEIAGL